MNEYQENILDNYKSPKNFGAPLNKGFVSHESTNLSCGDRIKVFVKIKPSQEGLTSDGIGFVAKDASKLGLSNLLPLQTNVPSFREAAIKKDLVEEIFFIGEGCSIAVGVTSILTEELKNKSVEYILNFTEGDLVKLVGLNFTLSRMKCATLGLNAIKQALLLSSTSQHLK